MDYLGSLNLSRELTPICQKKFIKKFYLILLNDKILFDVMGLKFRGEETNTPLEEALPIVEGNIGTNSHRRCILCD
jgi:hypothetical protein